jgi:hypothetical protein
VVVPSSIDGGEELNPAKVNDSVEAAKHLLRTYEEWFAEKNNESVRENAEFPT